jgi:putative two-component system response regulator
LGKITPDLILLDVEMPEMSGVEALRRLKAQPLYRDIPVIFLTSLTDVATEAEGFKLGVVDFITKPFSTLVLQNRIKTHLNIDQLIRERTLKMERLQSSIILVLADIVENRDRETAGHIDRTAIFTKILIEAMLKYNVYADEIKNWDIDMVISSARLHDIGKIAISDFILNKQGALTEKEFEKIKTHTTEGARIIDQIINHTGSIEFLRSAKLFAAYHHERWDGKGYHYKLKKTQIPLQGRIMAIVDVYDALCSERPYKKSFAQDAAVNIIINDSNRQFDPAIINVFSKVQDNFNEVKMKMSH